MQVEDSSERSGGGAWTPYISVCICTYNRRDSLMCALASLLCVEGPDGGFEVVVVDDGSADGTLASVERFAEAHTEMCVRVFRQEHGNVATARQLGLEVSRGEIVVITDDD